MPDQNQEPGTQSASAVWVAGTQIRDCHLLPWCALARSWNGELPGLEPSAPVWGAGIPGGILTAVPSAFPYVTIFKLQADFTLNLTFS